MKMSRSIRWIVLMLIALFVAPLIVSATPPAGPTARIDPRALHAVAQGEGTFWVVMRDKADLSPAYTMQDWNARGRFVVNQLQAAANASQARVRALLQTRGRQHQSFWIVNTIKVTADSATLNELASRPEVAEIAADQIYTISAPLPGTEEATKNSIQWGIDNIRAPQVWSSFGVTGSGIVVANIDTGVMYKHAALVRQYRGNLGGGSFNHNYNWYDPAKSCGNPSLAPCDNAGHGTHTMGIMVGDDGAGNQIGVAPSARWIAAKGCESSSCSTSSLLLAGQWVLAPTDLNGQNARADLRPNIVNNSWGSNNSADTFYRSTVQSWVASGIFPVFSNGNNGLAGCGSVGSPGSYSESYGVGSYDINNTIASTSSRGAAPLTVGGQIKPNISAPGVNISSSWNNGSYLAISGTSMAAPHLAGTIALMWSATPSLIGNISQTRTYLNQTAIDTSNQTCGGTAANNNVWGEGRLDAYAAVSAVWGSGPSGSLSGTVRDAGSGQPIAGAWVDAIGPTILSMQTNASGQYSMNLPSGSYSVTASQTGYTSQTVSGVVVSSGATTTRDFSLTAVSSNGTLSGTVRDAGTGQPIASATVSATGPTSLSAQTDSSGVYQMTLPSGTYSVTASKTGYTSQTVSGVVVSSGATTTRDFSLTVVSSNGTLSGTVRDAGTGQPIASATVSATGPTSLSAQTNTSGQYSMNLPSGSYSVTASKTGYTSQTVSGVVVSSGATTTRDFSLTVPGGNGTLSGTVRDAWTNQPLTNATVTAWGPTTLSVLTNTSGQYSMNLPSGSYSVTASRNKYYSQSMSGVVVSSGATTTQDFWLEPVDQCPHC